MPAKLISTGVDGYHVPLIIGQELIAIATISGTSVVQTNEIPGAIVPLYPSGRFGACRHSDGDLAVKRWHNNCGAKHGVDNINGLGPVEIAPMAFEARVFLGANNDEKITSGQAGRARWQAVTRHAQRHPLFHTHGNAQRKRFITHNLPFAATLRAWHVY